MTKNWFLFLAATAISSFPTQAQPVTPLVAASAPAWDAQQLATERQRIQSERSQVLARYEREAYDCAHSFVVTSCQHDARSHRVHDLDELQRQEAVLNKIERQRKAAQHLNKIDQQSRDRPPLPSVKASNSGRTDAPAPHTQDMPTSHQQTERDAQQRAAEAAQRQQQHAQA